MTNREQLQEAIIKALTEEIDGQMSIDEKGLPELPHPYRMKERTDGRLGMASSHPYDNTDYSWAVCKGMDPEDEWTVYDPNPEYSTYLPIDRRPAQNIKIDTVLGWNDALELMKELDSKKKPKIDRT